MMRFMSSTKKDIYVLNRRYNMAKYSTPGVYLKEIDKSEVLLTASIGGAATVVKSSQGPMWRPITINNNRQLSGIFGSPTLPEEDEFGRPVVPNYGYGLYAASNFLAEGQGLTLVRVADGDHVQIDDPANPGDTIDTPFLKDYTYATQTYGFHKITDVFTTEAPDPTDPNAHIIHEKAAQNRPNSITQILAIDESSKGQWKTENIENPNFGFAFAGGPSGQGYNVGTSVEFFYKGCSWMYKFDDENKIDTLVGMFDDLGQGHTTEQDIANYIDDNELVAPLVFQVKVYVKNVTDLWGTFVKGDMAAPVEIFECNATSRNLKTEQNTSLFISDVINGNSAYVYAKYLNKLTTLQVIKQITNRISYVALDYDPRLVDTVPTAINYDGQLEYDRTTGITTYGYKYDDDNSGYVFDGADYYNFEKPQFESTSDKPISVSQPAPMRNKIVQLEGDDPVLPCAAIDPAESGFFPPLNQGLTTGCTPSDDAWYAFGYTGDTVSTGVSDLELLWQNIDNLISVTVESAITQDINGNDVTAPLINFKYPEVIYWDESIDGVWNSNEYGPEIILADDGSGNMTPMDWELYDGTTIVGIPSGDLRLASIPKNNIYFDETPKYSPRSIMYWLDKVNVGAKYNIWSQGIGGTITRTDESYSVADSLLANKLMEAILEADKAYKQTVTNYGKAVTKYTVPAGDKVDCYVIDPSDDTKVISYKSGKIMKEVTQAQFDNLTQFPNSFVDGVDKVVEIDMTRPNAPVELPAYMAVLRMVDVNAESSEMFIAGHLDGGAEPDVDYDHLLDEGVVSGWMLMSDPEKYIAPHVLVPTYQTALKQFINSTFTPKRKRDCLQVSQSGDICINQDYDTQGDLHAEKIIAAEQFGYPNSSYIALYCGWGLVVDTANDREVWLPNAIFASQAIARTDNVANVWDAPAGQNRGVIPAIRQKFDMNNDEIGKVYDNNINASKEFMGIGSVLWGQKTAQRKASALDRINVRRTLLFIEKTVQLFLNPLILDVNNTPDIRLRVWNQINNFLQSVKAQNGLTDYQVICDDSNNPPEVIDANTLNVDILVKPVKTIEFIDVNVIVASTGLSFEEARVR